jgi:hypothetical protein
MRDADERVSAVDARRTLFASPDVLAPCLLHRILPSGATDETRVVCEEEGNQPLMERVVALAVLGSKRQEKGKDEDEEGRKMNRSMRYMR